MALSKQQLCAGMKRTRLSLEEKIKILNYSNKNQKKSCREIAAQFQIGMENVVLQVFTRLGQYYRKRR